MERQVTGGTGSAVPRGTACFVTGTDTGVGKTWVTCALVRLLRGRGLRVAALKAIESGCRPAEQGLVGEDDEALVTAAGGWQSWDQRCQIKFEAPVAPGVAAEDLGLRIDLDAIAAQVARLRATSDRLLVEGAGGWCVPLGDGRSTWNLARAVEGPVIIVGRAGLGTINHSVLTARAVAADGFQVHSIILSRRPGDSIADARRNAREVERLCGAPTILSDDLAGLDL